MAIAIQTELSTILPVNTTPLIHAKFLLTYVTISPQSSVKIGVLLDVAHFALLCVFHVVLLIFEIPAQVTFALSSTFLKMVFDDGRYWRPTYKGVDCVREFDREAHRDGGHSLYLKYREPFISFKEYSVLGKMLNAYHLEFRVSYLVVDFFQEFK